MTVRERVEYWKNEYDNCESGSAGAVEAFLSLYYLATFMASALESAVPNLPDDCRTNVTRILAQDEEDR